MSGNFLKTSERKNGNFGVFSSGGGGDSTYTHKWTIESDGGAGGTAHYGWIQSNGVGDLVPSNKYDEFYVLDDGLISLRKDRSDSTPADETPIRVILETGPSVVLTWNATFERWDATDKAFSDVVKTLIGQTIDIKIEHIG